MDEGKIGILTFHDTTNFGAVLQAVATYKVVKELGFNVEIIDYHCQNIEQREIPEKKFSCTNKNIHFWLYYFLCGYKEKRKHRDIFRFLNNEVEISDNYYTKENIKDSENKYESFLVGSDMLWCTQFTQSDYTFMLDFVKEKNKKNAFATSVGYAWSQKEIPYIVSLLNDFNRIAVREEDICQVLNSLLNIHVQQVCDPTMLIEPKDWLKYTGDKKEKGYVLVYMDDNDGNCITSAIKYAKKNEKKVKKLEFKVNGVIKKDYKYIEAYSVEDFLSAIKNAKILFTASYHGMLFAIYFHIPFVFFNKDSSRLQTVANQLGLQYRDGMKYDIDSMGKIEWEAVDKKRNSIRKKSLEILKEMLQNNG